MVSVRLQNAGGWGGGPGAGNAIVPHSMQFVLPETEFTSLILASKSEVSIDSHTSHLSPVKFLKIPTNFFKSLRTGI